MSEATAAAIGVGIKMEDVQHDRCLGEFKKGHRSLTVDMLWESEEIDPEVEYAVVDIVNNSVIGVMWHNGIAAATIPGVAYKICPFVPSA
ncbi:MAG: hypothetical protein ACREEM_04500 [Blastocatellia bacterium]